jgi:mono/diheme cytochrome c family protein
LDEKMLRSSAFFTAGLIGFAIGLNHAKAAEAPPFDLRDPKQIAAGLQTFNATCTQYCHGKDGRIGRGPELRRRPDLSAEQIHATIANGRRESSKVMPSWKGSLTDETIWQLTAYIVSLRDAQ